MTELTTIVQKQATTIQALTATVDELQAVQAESLRFTTELQKKIASQKELIAKLQRMLFGPRSERVVRDLTGQVLLPGFAELMQEQEAAEKSEPEKESSLVKEHERASSHRLAGWNEFPANLERVEVVLTPPADEIAGLQLSGYETSERLKYRNAYYVEVIKRAKYVEPGAAGFGVLAVAPPPALPACLAPDSSRCHYDISVIVHIITNKLLNHLPFYRQSEMFARLGITFGRSVMCDYFVKVSIALQPLYETLCRLILECQVLQADETGLSMLDPGSGKTRKTWIWVRKTGIGPPLTAFHFDLSRSSGVAQKLLGNYHGTILRDGYAAYGELPALAACCWAHARRKFHEAENNHPQYAQAALGIIRQLYAIEDAAREEAALKSGETALFKARKRGRLLSAGRVDAYFKLCTEIVTGQPPSSAIAKAAAYALKIEKELRRFLDDPRLNIDNNACENVIRPFCIGRRNWLFVGSAGGGTSMAVLASFAATCKDNGVDFERWLADVLFRLDTTPAARVAELLPHEWQKRRQAESAGDTAQL